MKTWQNWAMRSNSFQSLHDVFIAICNKINMEALQNYGKQTETNMLLENWSDLFRGKKSKCDK